MKKQENDITHMKEQSDEHVADHDNPYYNELEDPPEEIYLSNVNNEEGNDEANAGEEGNKNPIDIDKMKENMQKAAEKQPPEKPKDYEQSEDKSSEEDKVQSMPDEENRGSGNQVEQLANGNIQKELHFIFVLNFADNVSIKLNHLNVIFNAQSNLW